MRSRAAVGGRALAAAIAGSALGLCLSSANAEAATHTVVIDATAFGPPTLVVHRGDTVVWVNKDPFPHTVSAQDQSFDSMDIGAGKSWRRTFAAKGSHAYICRYHPTMKGDLRVE